VSAQPPLPDAPPPSPDAPRPSSFQGPLGHPRLHLRSTDSTNDRARDLAVAGAPHGTLVSADEQTAGRGRHGRRWSAAPRSALLMSLLLRWPEGGEPPRLLPHAAAVAVCDVVGPRALVKWPNDVVFRREARPTAKDATARYTDLAKLAGILIEGRPQERWLVLGIGLNVAVNLADLPEEVQPTAATLGLSPDAIEPTLSALLHALERRLAQPPAEILAAWRERDALAGSQVTWKIGSGEALGIDDHGSLLVRAQDGSILALDSGEVSAAGVAPHPN
jgi:BirA family transcriptional regulator, biotin operon repressor / biotin---[acetyl-CoA-carboxylase] ligase